MKLDRVLEPGLLGMTCDLLYVGVTLREEMRFLPEEAVFVIHRAFMGLHHLWDLAKGVTIQGWFSKLVHQNHLNN